MVRSPFAESLGPGQAIDTPASGVVAPRAGWPAKSTLDYLKTGIELLFLLLAIPWVLRELIRHPRTISRKAASHHIT